MPATEPNAAPVSSDPWVSAVLGVVLVFLVLLMRRSVAEKGAHLAAE
jgi:hypothetical protein